MNIIYLLLGGNQGNRIENLAAARAKLAILLGEVVAQSPIYETAAWGKADQGNFLNQALKINTLHNPFEALSIINQIEQQLGRQRTEHWGERTLDIDILFFNDEQIHTARLVIPHPELANRRFALIPMMDIAAQVKHPSSGKTIEELLAACPDKLDVQLFAFE